LSFCFPIVQPLAVKAEATAAFTKSIITRCKSSIRSAWTGKNNECGGIYSKADSKLNMCLPPLQWQAYDVEFTNAVSENGKKTKNAVITIRLNGVVIHDKLEIAGKTGGSRNAPEGTPGAIKLQGHGNPLQFRNVWIVEKE